MSIKINLPDIGADEVEVIEVLVNVGDKIEVEQSLIIVEGSKASIEIPSPIAGIVEAIKVVVGDRIKTGNLIMFFEDNTNINYNKSTSIELCDIEDKNKTVKEEDNVIIVHATPLVRRLARKFDINLINVIGSGRKGRILYEDIQSYIKNSIKNNLIKNTEYTLTHSNIFPRLLPWPKVDFSKFGEIEEVELGHIQNISGNNLHRNWIMIPHVTQFDEADITELEKFRMEQNIKIKKLNLKITPTVFIMKAVAKALEELPKFNSSLSDNSQKIILKKYINIGVAVDTSFGLFVPVFRDVNKKNIIELSSELTELSKKAHAGKLDCLDMQGGCFTISNLGSVGGGTAFTPIINAPEVGILGISKSLIKPVWNGEEFVPKTILPLSLSYDHRVIDGADGVRFITIITKIISDIRQLVM